MFGKPGYISVLHTETTNQQPANFQENKPY